MERAKKYLFLETFCKSFVLVGIMLGGAALCIVWDFFRIHTLFKNKYTWIYVCFIAATAVSSVAWIKYGVYSNAVILCYLCAEIFIMYQFDASRGKDALFKDFKIICSVVCVLSLLLSLYSLLTYFAYIEYGYKDSTGNILSQGYKSAYRRVWGGYIETNFQGIMDIFVLYMSALFANKANKKLERYFWCINIVIHFICLVLTGSRSSLIAFLISAFFVGAFASRVYINRACKPTKELAKRLFAGVLSAVAALALFIGVKTGIPYVQKAIVNSLSFETRLEIADAIDRLYMSSGIDIWGELADYVEQEDTESDSIKEIIIEAEEIVRKDIEAKEDTSNGRLHLWIDSLKLFAKYPLLGLSPANRAEIVKAREIDVCKEIKLGWTLLNGYLEVLVGSGIVGFILVAGFLFACVSRLWKYDRRYGKYSFEIACILGVIVGEMVFALFLSELFYIKSVHTYLFWIVLGYAMAVIEIEETEQKRTAGDYAFVCDTPLQVLNAVSLVATDVEGCSGHSDLFLYHQFKNSEQISAAVKESGVFRNVYDFSPFSKRTGFRSKATTFARILNPGSTLSKQYRGKGKTYARNDYGTLMLSFYTPFSDIVHLALDTPRTVQFEDGTASYVTENLERRYRSGIFEAYNRYIASDKLSYHPEKLYLSNPMLCTFDSLPLKKASGIGENKEVRALAKKIFGYRQSAYQGKCVIYLTQPFGTAEGGELVTAREQACLNMLKTVNPILRVHPRQLPEAFDGFSIDTVGNMWELECAEHIDDSKVLIGAFSTAQLAPKMLFDREPTLVFLYKLYGSRFDHADELIEKVKTCYRNPDKIMIPQTSEELASILKKL